MAKYKINESSPLYKFADRLKELRDKEGYTNKELKKAIEGKLGYEFSESTLNNWLQHYGFPDNEKLVAICKVFPPYSVDYFMGVIDKPSYDLAFIEEYTGLSCETIERLKDISESWPKEINEFFLDNYLLDEIIYDTSIIKFEKSKIDYDESVAIKWFYEFAQKYRELLEMKKENKIPTEELLDLLDMELRSIQSHIAELSDDKLRDSIPYYRILQAKEDMRETLNYYSSTLCRNLMSEKYKAFTKVYDKYLKPLKDKPELSTECLNNVLIPLREYIEKNFDLTGEAFK